MLHAGTGTTDCRKLFTVVVLAASMCAASALSERAAAHEHIALFTSVSIQCLKK